MWQPLTDHSPVPQAVLIGKIGKYGAFMLLGYRMDGQIDLFRKFDPGAPHCIAPLPTWIAEGAPQHPQWICNLKQALPNGMQKFVMGERVAGEWRLLGMHETVSRHRWHVTRKGGDFWYALLPRWVFAGPDAK